MISELECLKLTAVDPKPKYSFYMSFGFQRVANFPRQLTDDCEGSVGTIGWQLGMFGSDAGDVSWVVLMYSCCMCRGPILSIEQELRSESERLR